MVCMLIGLNRLNNLHKYTSNELKIKRNTQNG